MNVKNIHFNPFALSTAKSAWNNNKSSLASRVCKSVTGAVYDIYVKNPYDLTVGNCKSLYNSPEAHSTTQKVAIVAMAAFASLYTLMLYGTSIHVAGRGLVALAGAVNSPLLTKIGQAVKLCGEKAFIAGAVPIYGLFYALPKQLIRSFPEAVKFVADKVALVTTWVFHNVLTPVWDKVLLPATKHLITAIRFVVDKVTTVLAEVAKKVLLAASWTIEHVLTPLWEKALLPALKQVVRAIEFAVTSVVELGKKVATAAIWVVENIIVPLWDKALLPALRHIATAAEFVVTTIAEVAEKIINNGIIPALKIIQRGISYLATGIYNVAAKLVCKIADVAEWAFEHVLAPVWKTVVMPTVKGLIRFSISAITLAAKTISTLAEATAKAASFIFQRVILPVGEFLGTHVVVPVASLVKAAAVKAAQAASFIFNEIIVPVAEVVVAAVTELKDKAIVVKNEVWNTITFAWNSVAARFA